MNAYDRWIEVSDAALADPHCVQVLEVIRAASAALAEKHDEIARLERGKTTTKCPGPPHAGHASSDWCCPLDWQPGDPLCADQLPFLR